jgi:hypothetical protein
MSVTREVTPFYRELMAEIDRRRQLLGLSSIELENRVGMTDGHYQKAIHADAPSGRVLSWPLLECLCGALYPAGFRIQLRDVGPPPPGRRRRRMINGWLRAHMTRIAKMQTFERRSRARQKLSRRRRKEIAQVAARARWDKIHRARERLARVVPASERRSTRPETGNSAPLA